MHQGPSVAVPPPSHPVPGGRIVGVEVARALAIVGMLAVHVPPVPLEGHVGGLYALAHGRASVLFVLVAGVGVSLLAASRSRSLGEARGLLVWRALILLPLGLALQEFDRYVLVILQSYAVLFALGIAVLRVPDRWVLALAAVAATAGPLGFLAGQVFAPETFNRAPISIRDPIGEIGHGLLFSGPYPLMTWAAPFLLGMWLGRRDLRALSLHVILIAAGGAVAVLAVVLSGALETAVGRTSGWYRVVVATPHSQMPLWLLGGIGSAVMVLGAALLAAQLLGRRLLWPLAAVGQMALTVYIGHILVLRQWREALTPEDGGEADLLVLLLAAGAAGFSMIWLAVWSRGPLESLLRLPRLHGLRGGARS